SAWRWSSWPAARAAPSRVDGDRADSAGPIATTDQVRRRTRRAAGGAPRGGGGPALVGGGGAGAGLRGGSRRPRSPCMRDRAIDRAWQRFGIGGSDVAGAWSPAGGGLRDIAATHLPAILGPALG